MELKKTVERIVPKNFKTREEYLLYLRHQFAYEQALHHLDPDSRVLEIGFGEGYGTHLLSLKIASVTGVDVDLEAVNYAGKTYGSKNCRFLHYPGDRLPFDDGQFEAVVSFQVIEHIEDDENYLREINRVLKKNGKALLTTPNRETRLKPGEKPWNRFHVREYSARQLEDLLGRHFNSVRIFGVKGSSHVEKIERNRVRRWISLYKLAPGILKRLITKDFESEYSTDVFHLDGAEVRSSMDLFAIVEK